MKGNTVDKFILAATAIGILVYWGIFFATLGLQSGTLFARTEPCWLKWELSFPLADIFFAIVMGVAFILHLRKTRLAFAFQAVASGGIMFLALIDITFFFENRLYVSKDGVIEGWLHAWLLFAGIYLMISSIRNLNSTGGKP